MVPSSPSMRIVHVERLHCARWVKTGDELEMWRWSTGRSMKQAAEEIGLAYNTYKKYEDLGYRLIPQPVTLAIAALDMGIIPDNPGAYGRFLAMEARQA